MDDNQVYHSTIYNIAIKCEIFKCENFIIKLNFLFTYKWLVELIICELLRKIIILNKRNFSVYIFKYTIKKKIKKKEI